MVEAIAAARVAVIPIVYVNDQVERWDADALGLIRSALAARLGGEVIAPLAPEPGDRFVLNPAIRPSITLCSHCCYRS